MATRVEVRAQILGCEGCELSKRCTPVPFEGPAPARLAVVGEAPAKLEDEVGRPFVSPSGELLKSTMRDAGIDLNDVFYMSAVSCFPTKEDGTGRSVEQVEVDACRPNLDAQLELSGATFYLLTGGVPLGAVRRGRHLKIGKARGVPFFLDATPQSTGSRIAMATYHPSYIIRSGGINTSQGKLWKSDIEAMAALMRAPDGSRVSLFPDTCIECGEPAERWDDDGIGWCVRHG